ncbi:hypothetical protein GCM10025861_20840 [Methanobacterium petrolearium]|nr:hypothetical protein GCM10025861_20840 [Methanobacterium petrolearium]
MVFSPGLTTSADDVPVNDAKINNKIMIWTYLDDNITYIYISFIICSFLFSRTN